MNDGHLVAHVLRKDFSAPAVYVAEHVANAVGRRYKFYFHDRFEDVHAALVAAFLHRRAGGDLEGHGGRVCFMIRGVVEDDFHIDYGKADEYAVVPHRSDALFDGQNDFVGYRPLGYCAFENVALIRPVGFKFQDNAGELDVTICPLIVRVVDLCGARERLAIGNLRRSANDPNAELMD